MRTEPLVSEVVSGSLFKTVTHRMRPENADRTFRPGDIVRDSDTLVYVVVGFDPRRREYACVAPNHFGVELGTGREYDVSAYGNFAKAIPEADARMYFTKFGRVDREYLPGETGGQGVPQ